MKKLTLLFWGLMLLLGFGTAFAENAIPTPTFTPASGSTVSPSAIINFIIPSSFTEDDYMGVVILYVENNDTVKLEASKDELYAAAQEDAGIGGMEEDEEVKPRLWKTAMYDLEEGIWWNHVSVSSTATGTVKLRMRLAAITWDNEVEYSEEMTATYTIDADAKAEGPTFDPASGVVDTDTKIKISGGDPENLYIPYYVVNGSDEDFDIGFFELQSTQKLTAYYGEEDAPKVTSAMTLKAAIAYINVMAKTVVWSNITTATYTVKGEGPVVVEKDTLPMPKFSVAAGEVEKGTTVVLSCDTADAKIYYSINADTVTENSLEYTAAIAIDSAMTISAIAVKEGLENSPVAVATYTIKGEGTANEGKELTGVSVYPNPSTGVFHIELPVAATVEVFASNGVLVRSFNAAAGKSTLSLDHSGIYFVRIMGEGRTTVKRVIVR